MQRPCPPVFNLALNAAARRSAVLGSLAGWALAGPAVLALAVLLLAPTAALLAASLTDMELGGPPLHWVGLDNYAELLRDPAFRGALRNTLTYVAVVLPASVLIGLGLALLIEGGTRGRALLRAVFFLPVVSLLVAMATAWEYLLHPTIGPVNQVLGLLGIAPVNWLGLILPGFCGSPALCVDHAAIRTRRRSRSKLARP